MSNISRRIEKLENKMQSMEVELGNRQAKLLELQRLEKTEPIKALFLRAELEYGRKVTLVELLSNAHRQDTSRDEK
jgi:hypothetical protein